MMSGFTGNYIKVHTPYDVSLVNTVTRVILGPWDEDNQSLNCSLADMK
jgi:hypothetical protein